MKNKIDIFSYYDYRKYLKDIFSYLKKEKKTSLRSLAEKSNLAVSYLSMIVSGKRSLDIEKADQLFENLNLNDSELKFLKYLIQFNDCKDATEQSRLFERLKRYKKFKENYEESFNAHQYLSKWYYVAIRELSFSKDFQENAEWIQDKFFPNLSQLQIKEAIHFLKENHLLGNEEASYLDDIECLGDVHKMSLKKFHYQMLDITKESIEKVDSQKRNIQGYTKTLSPEGFEKAKKILNSALTQIREIGDDKQQTRDLYHFYFLGFPLTIKEGENA